MDLCQGIGGWCRQCGRRSSEYSWGDICVLDALDSLGGAYKKDLFGSEDNIKIIGDGRNDIWYDDSKYRSNGYGDTRRPQRRQKVEAGKIANLGMLLVANATIFLLVCVTLL